MKVLLKEDMDNLGYAGEVLTVADGYGRNFLIPQGKAVKASPSVLKQATVWRERAAVRMIEVKKEHEALAARVTEETLEFTARAGETGKLYGSITTADVVEQLNAALGTEEIDRRSVVGGPLRQLGEHKVTIRLSRDNQPQVTVIISPFVEVEEEIVEIEAEAGVEEIEVVLEAEEIVTLVEESTIEAAETEAGVEEIEVVLEAEEIVTLVEESTIEAADAAETVDDAPEA